MPYVMFEATGRSFGRHGVYRVAGVVPSVLDCGPRDLNAAGIETARIEELMPASDPGLTWVVGQKGTYCVEGTPEQVGDAISVPTDSSADQRG